MSLAIVEVRDAETVREIVFGLRVESWKSVGVLTDGRFPPDICQDEHDAHALHWAAFDGERLVGAARMCVHDALADLPDAGFFEEVKQIATAPIASINRLVVDPEYQRRGLSRNLDQARIQRARELSCRAIWCVAPPIRWGPLERQGFQVVAPASDSHPPEWLAKLTQGPVPSTPLIERRVMVLTLGQLRER